MAAKKYLIKLVPELSAAALRAKKDKELALWYELRAINSTGSRNPGEQWSSGVLVVNEAVAELVTCFGYSLSTVYRLLKNGDGKFWEISRNYRTSGHIRLYGMARVCECLNIYRVGRPIQITSSEFIGRKLKRAWLYASFFKEEESRARAKPISRESIRDATSVLRRQQRRYEKAVKVKRVANFAFQQGYDGKSIMGIPDLVSGKHRQYKVLRRLGNSYYSRADAAPRGMTKKINARQRSLIRGEARLPQRFFFSVKSLIRSPKRDPEAFLLVNNRDRLIRGRMEWYLA